MTSNQETTYAHTAQASIPAATGSQDTKYNMHNHVQLHKSYALNKQQRDNMAKRTNTWLTHDKVAKKITTSTTYRTANPVQCKTTIQLLRGKHTIAGSVDRIQCNRLLVNDS